MSLPWLALADTQWLLPFKTAFSLLVLRIGRLSSRLPSAMRVSTLLGSELKSPDVILSLGLPFDLYTGMVGHGLVGRMSHQDCLSVLQILITWFFFKLHLLEFILFLNNCRSCCGCQHSSAPQSQTVTRTGSVMAKRHHVFTVHWACNCSLSSG